MRYKTTCYNSIFIIIVLNLTLSGCAFQIHHLPKGQQVNSQEIVEFTSPKTFQIINNQPSNEKLIIGTSYLGSFYSSLFEFSEAAVQLLEDELILREMTDSIDGEKVLMLSVTGVELTEVAFRWKCVVAMDMETGEGYKTSFHVQNFTPSNTRVCGGAITLAITELLKDQNVINYLKN